MTDQYMTQHYGAVVVENSPYSPDVPGGHGLDVCCAYMGELIELSNGYVCGIKFAELWDIEMFVETRKEIQNHVCEYI